MTTYTVYPREHGTVYGENLTVEQAADVILSHDGHEWLIKPTEDRNGFDLFVSRGSRNAFGGTRGWVQAQRGGKPIWSMKADAAAAWRDIAQQVVTAGWEGLPEAMTTESYNAMMKEAGEDR